MSLETERSAERANASQTKNKVSHNTNRINANPCNSKGFAAVFEAHDPRAATVARVIPADAVSRTFGNATLGYYKGGPKRKTWREVMAGQRFNELARLSAYRHCHGLALGSSNAWARVLVNLALALAGAADVEIVSTIARNVRAPKLDLDLVAALCALSFRGLMPAAVVGDELEVTSCERADCCLVRIDAVDECQADRRRRLDRERKARSRCVRRTLLNTVKRTHQKAEPGRAGRGARRLSRRYGAETALSSRQAPQASFYPYLEKVRSAPSRMRPASRIARGHVYIAEGQARNQGDYAVNDNQLSLSVMETIHAALLETLHNRERASIAAARDDRAVQAARDRLADDLDWLAMVGGAK